MNTPDQIRERLKELPHAPGVYRMLDARADVIYVGKARNLRKRVSSYFTKQSGVTPKVRAMVAAVDEIEITVTSNEGEALLLESNLIKELKPRYNVVLRDDKSYPYIYAAVEHEFPRLRFHRGARRGKGRYFGPFPSAGAVRDTLNLLQKLFLIRQCEDTFFKNRSRPCLQYQIKRCTAPCVGEIDSESYRRDVDHAMLFLEGRSEEVVEYLVTHMNAASEALEFERAARLRDQIQQLQRVRSEQNVSTGEGEFDVIACESRGALSAVQVFFVRYGRILGNKCFFPAHTDGLVAAEVLNAFLGQFYLSGNRDRDLPPTIIVSEQIEDEELFIAALGERRGKPVAIKTNVRGERAKWIKMARDNATVALEQRLSSASDYARRIAALGEFLSFDEPLERLECFDISHLSGESTVASCVVFGEEGAKKSDYRRFNIKNAGAGDDYAAMDEALLRRYRRLKEEDAKLPSAILIDGGKGQVSRAIKVLEELQLEDIPVIGIAKGPSRRPGLETLVLAQKNLEKHLHSDSPALLLLQQIRDEAHRFAIEAHRKSRAKTRTHSSLEDVEGVGAKRRQKLMQHFGGLQGIQRAGVDDLQRVPGISRALAEKIYDAVRR
ncbi:MAG: excinuclease ABC subunit UvrC [Pseudomonadota bacterium]